MQEDKEGNVQENMMNIKLNVSLTAGGGGTVSPDPDPVPNKIVGGGTIWQVKGAIVNEIRLIVGSIAKPFTLNVFDEEGKPLTWAKSGPGVSMEPPPPPPGVSNVIRSG